MARRHIALAAAAMAGVTQSAVPAHAACAAPLVNAPAATPANCGSSATAYSMTVTTGGVSWYVGCNGAVAVPLTTTWAPGGGFGALPGGCTNATIVLTSLMNGTNALGQLT